MAGGADVVVDYTSDGWQKSTSCTSRANAVDLVYDPVGKIEVSLWSPTGGKGACLLSAVRMVRPSISIRDRDHPR